jgi:hypothetical protein
MSAAPTTTPAADAERLEHGNVDVGEDVAQVLESVRPRGRTTRGGDAPGSEA